MITAAVAQRVTGEFRDLSQMINLLTMRDNNLHDPKMMNTHANGLHKVRGEFRRDNNLHDHKMLNTDAKRCKG